MTDQLEELFAELRAGTLPSVRPPGSVAARRTVRRRRAVRGVTAAAVAVLAVAGGLVAGLRSAPERTPVATPTSPPVTYWGTEPVDRLSDVLKIEPDSAGAHRIITDVSTPQISRHQLVGGTYDVVLACYGAGVFDVTISAGTAGVTEAMTCDPAPVPRTVPFPVPGTSALVAVRIEGRGVGEREAAIGYRFDLNRAGQQRLAETAKAAITDLPSAGRDFVLGGSEFIDGGIRYSSMSEEGRRFSLRAACAGTGRLDIRVSSDFKRITSKPVVCTPEAVSPVTIDFTVARDAEQLDIDISATAERQSAVAFELDRLR